MGRCPVRSGDAAEDCPVTDRLAGIEAKLDRITEALAGDIRDPSKPGITTRLDRLEQDRDRQKMWTGWIGAAAVTAVVATATKWLKG